MGREEGEGEEEKRKRERRVLGVSWGQAVAADSRQASCIPAIAGGMREFGAREAS